MTLGFYEVGFRVGRWVQDRTADVVEEGPNGVLVGSIVALMAFLLAITTGMASDRFDARRLTSSRRRTRSRRPTCAPGYIAEPGSSEARALLESYIPLRITTGDPAAVAAAIVQSEELQRQLWAVAENAARQDSSDVTALFVESINDVITVHEQRVTAGVYARVPPTILWVLVLGSALSLGMVGYSAGITKTAEPGDAPSR